LAQPSAAVARASSAVTDFRLMPDSVILAVRL
jgi:hypothetical protein